MDLSIFFFLRYVEHENHRKMDGKKRKLEEPCPRFVDGMYLGHLEPIGFGYFIARRKQLLLRARRRWLAP